MYTVRSGYHKDCWHEKTGRCHHFVSPGATVGSGWHLQSCERTSTSDQDLSWFVPLVSFSQKIISIHGFLLHANTTERSSGSQYKSSLKKNSVLHISTIFSRCMSNWEANLQKQRDYISLKMSSFRDV